MKFDALAERISAKVLTPGQAADVDLDQVYAGDRMSDLLNAAGDHTLLVTNLATNHLVRVAELMDIPGICLVAGQVPDEGLLAAARAQKTLVMVSSAGLFETCGRIHQCLVEEKRSRP